MADKEVFERELVDGSLVRYHVDHEKSEVFIETGGKHPNTGEPLLRFSSNNTAPFPKTVNEPAAFEELFEAPLEVAELAPVVVPVEESPSDFEDVTYEKPSDEQ